MAIAERKNWNGMSQAKLKIHTFTIFVPELKEMAPAVKVVLKTKNIYVARSIIQMFLA